MTATVMGCLILGKLYFDSKDVAKAWAFMAIAVATILVEALR